MSDLACSVPDMAKFDPVVFQKMMDELNAEDERQRVIVRTPLEDFEPDFGYVPTKGEVIRSRPQQ